MADESAEIVKEMAESVAATNLKVVADGPAYFTNHLFDNANSASRGWTNINQAVVGKISESIVHTNPGESAGDAVIAAILGKVMQSTHPISANPIAGSA